MTLRLLFQFALMPHDLANFGNFRGRNLSWLGKRCDGAPATLRAFGPLLFARAFAAPFPSRAAGGRPPGARTRLSHKLIEDLSAIWHDNGPDILRKMAMREPATLARMAYATLPRDILVSVEQRIPGRLSSEDWLLLTQVLDMIRAAIAPGSNAPPAEVFGVIETGLRAHFAREIDAEAAPS